MRYTARAYRDPEDLRLIRDHIRGLWRADGPLAPIHPGDITWWTRQHEKPAGHWERRIRLWFDGAELAGWAIVGHPDSLDAFPRADLRGSELHTDMLDWFAAEATQIEDGVVDAITAYALDCQRDTAAFLRAAASRRGMAGPTITC